MTARTVPSPLQPTPGHDLVGAFQGIGEEIVTLVSQCDDDQLRRRYHPDLSPIGWHGGHVAVVEAFWLCEVLAGNPLEADLKAFYFPESSPKDVRSRRLPDGPALRAMMIDLHSEACARAREIGAQDQSLPDGGFALRFLIQHHWQHREILSQIAYQRALGEAAREPATQQKLAACAPRPPTGRVPGRNVVSGSDCPEAFDNEQPPHEQRIEPFDIAPLPVTNAEFLGFVEAGGYADPTYWDAAGWAWRTSTGSERPALWRTSALGVYTVDTRGPAPLPADAPVTGLSWYEARAFARYAHARLPTEPEWETAAGDGVLQQAGVVWEWCNSVFAPYPDFRPFPYRGYSTPWFDGHHKVLKGGSSHSGPWLKRPSLRNFYTPATRHIFAGLRLARDSST